MTKRGFSCSIGVLSQKGAGRVARLPNEAGGIGMKYNVIVYVTIRIEIADIEADSERGAALNTMKQVDLYDLIDRAYVDNVESIIYTGEGTNFTVCDIHGNHLKGYSSYDLLEKEPAS